MKKFKKMLVVLFIIGGVLLVSKGISNARAAALESERAAVEEYVTCLKENFTQRDYCARKQGQNYHLLDQQMKKYGYDYVQKGYDLYVVEIDK